jgi:hypothetical protein
MTSRRIRKRITLDGPAPNWRIRHMTMQGWRLVSVESPSSRLWIYHFTRNERN